MFVRERIQEPADPAREEALEELPLEQLEQRITELASRMTAGMARWIALVGEFDRRDGWGEAWGCRSTAHWIAWRCAMSPRAAREHVRVARVLPELPGIRSLFESGRLSYAKV